jgi:hypothetical protein
MDTKRSETGNLSTPSNSSAPSKSNKIAPDAPTDRTCSELEEVKSVQPGGKPVVKAKSKFQMDIEKANKQKLQKLENAKKDMVTKLERLGNNLLLTSISTFASLFIVGYGSTSVTVWESEGGLIFLYVGGSGCVQICSMAVVSAVRMSLRTKVADKESNERETRS